MAVLRSGTHESRALRARPTRTAWYLGALAGLVGLAALNTGANLLFLVLALLLATLAHAAFAGRHSLDSLELALNLPRLQEALAPARGELRLSGGGPETLRIEADSWLPEGGLRIEGSGRVKSFATGFLGRAPRRGVVRALTLELSTRAPYGLFERRRRLPVTVLSHVHPRLLDPRPVAAAAVAAAGRDAPASGEDGSLRDLRAYGVGDNPRHIHWRRSARSGELFVRRFHAEQRHEVRIEIETAGLEESALEARLEEAATALRDGLNSGLRVDLQLPGERIRCASAADLAAGLRALSRAGDGKGASGAR